MVPRVVAPRRVTSRRERRVPTLVTVTWAALFVNVLGWAQAGTLIPLPHTVGKIIAQAALGLAVVLALLVNRRLMVRPQLFLVLLAMLGLVALMVSIHNPHEIGSTYRATRMLAFVAVLWLMTPWFGRRDMLLLRCHINVMRAVLVTVTVGAVIAPGKAFAFQGRLSGTLWPIPPTQVAHYAAITIGTTTVLWFCGIVSERTELLTAMAGGALLVATHTRTALLALVVGLVVAGASLFIGHARVRRTWATATVMGVLGLTVFASQLTTWLLRGQTAQDATQFTGRTKVWSQIFALQRPELHTMFGDGMSNMSFHGLAIDSNWVATYLDEGWFGVIVDAVLLLVLLGMALTHVRGPQRAVALFLVVYCIIASITETGLGAPSPYLLDLSVAAALLAPAVRSAA